MRQLPQPEPLPNRAEYERIREDALNFSELWRENSERTRSATRQEAIDYLPVWLDSTGFLGWRTASLAHVNLHVGGDSYGIIEYVHQSLMHILSQYIRMMHMPAELIVERKF